MEWKNQLTKTPILVLFIILISVGVGTASALITITLAGDVHVTGDTTLDGDLTVGAGSSSNDDFIRLDGGNENIQWDESQTRFRLSDSIVTGGHFAAGSISADDTVNRFGDGTPQSSESMTGFGDLYLADDLEVTDNLFLGGELDCDGCIDGADISGTSKLFFGTCSSSPPSIMLQPGETWVNTCFDANVSAFDAIVATIDTNNSICFDLVKASSPVSGEIDIFVRNNCETQQLVAGLSVSYIIFRI